MLPENSLLRNTKPPYAKSSAKSELAKKYPAEAGLGCLLPLIYST